jgi:hypothetical protein
MKKMLFKAMSRLRVSIRLPYIEFRLDLAVPVVLITYLLAHWMR